jgi:hypothetical protein
MNLAIIRATAVAVAVSCCGVPGVARADATMGRLVYHFSYGTKQNVTARDAPNNMEIYGVNSGQSESTQITGGTNGISHYAGVLEDKGTMTVDLMKQQADGALVVMISEQGENVRRAPPALCVVYGNTHVLCDPNKTVYTEEYTLLRFLGRNFVDPSALDAKKHWMIVQDSGGLNVRADYTIDGNQNGKMAISETRSVRQAGGGSLTTDIQTKIGL